MIKYFVVAQVNGCFSKLIENLKKKNFNFKNKEDILVVLGNFMGHGEEQVKLFYFLKNLKNNNKCIVLIGSEENFFLERKNFFPITLKNEINQSEIKEDIFANDLKEFLKTCPYYFEGSSIIFVSAGVNPNLKNWKETPKSGLYWNDSMIWMFNDQLQRVKNGDYKKLDKRVITGFQSSLKFHFYIENGFLDNYLYTPDESLLNEPFELNNFISIGGSWHYEKNNIIYVVNSKK